MKIATLTFKTTIRASQQIVFNYVSDWEKQSDWIMFTDVKILTNPTTQKDVSLLAVTKIGPIKLVDTMVVTDWQPFERIVVEHTGRIILGKGVFTVRKISDHSCEFQWQEVTPVPFGLIGRIGLTVFKPLIELPFRISLHRLKSNIESRQ